VTRVLILLSCLVIATPAAAQNAFAWPESKQPIAETASNIAVYSAIGLDTLHSWRSPDRSNAFACQAIRLGVTIGTAELLKRVVHKERPDGSDFKSFPSMHTGVAMASAGWKWQVGIPLAIGTGVFRMGANKHDIVDVLAGAGIGYLSSHVGPCSP
jgi:membrane-associated phospholipid phosphatase